MRDIQEEKDMKGVYVEIKPNKWIMIGGCPFPLSYAEEKCYIEAGIIKDKLGSENGEMEYTDTPSTPKDKL